jgi:hypothetical protein
LIYFWRKIKNSHHKRYNLYRVNQSERRLTRADFHQVPDE